MTVEAPSGSDPADEDLRAVDGRVPGRRGLATRQKLLSCTLEMLGDHTYRDLRVVDIARSAGTSPATFYQYFPDVNTAILALAEEMVVDASSTLLALVREGPWKGGAGFDTATAIAGGFISMWERHWPLMRVMELTSAEGDERFRHVRTRLLNQFTVALADVIREMGVARGVDTTDPMATAGVLVSMLAHVAAHRYGFEFYGIRAGDLETSMAHILFTSVTGQEVPTTSSSFSTSDVPPAE